MTAQLSVISGTYIKKCWLSSFEAQLQWFKLSFASGQAICHSNLLSLKCQWLTGGKQPLTGIPFRLRAVNKCNVFLRLGISWTKKKCDTYILSHELGKSQPIKRPCVILIMLICQYEIVKEWNTHFFFFYSYTQFKTEIWNTQFRNLNWSSKQNRKANWHFWR